MVDTNEMISQTEDVRNGQEVSLDTCSGGGFMVGLYLRSKSEFTYKTFDDLDAAMEVYIRFVTAIVKGEGSYEERRSWLKSDRVRYYSIRRPVGPGTYPAREKALDICNFDRREYVEAIQREAWGYIDYAAALDPGEAESYELVQA